MKQKLLRSWRIAQSQFKDHTLQEFISILIKSLFRVERILIYVKDLNQGITHSPNNTLYNSITKGDLSELENVRKKMLSPYWEFCCHLYDGVKEFFVYKENGEIGHISWIYFKRDPNRLLLLADEECEVKFCMTLPQYRGRGIYPTALIKIQTYLKETGYRRAFICVKDDNTSSIRGIEKSGFSSISRITLVKLMGIQLTKRYSSPA